MRLTHLKPSSSQNERQFLSVQGNHIHSQSSNLLERRVVEKKDQALQQQQSTKTSLYQFKQRRLEVKAQKVNLRKHASHSTITKANLRKLKQLSSPIYEPSPRGKKNMVSISAFVNLSPQVITPSQTQKVRAKEPRDHQPKKSVVIYSRNQEVIEHYQTSSTPRKQDTLDKNMLHQVQLSFVGDSPIKSIKNERVTPKSFLTQQNFRKKVADRGSSLTKQSYDSQLSKMCSSAKKMPSKFEDQRNLESNYINNRQNAVSVSEFNYFSLENRSSSDGTKISYSPRSFASTNNQLNRRSVTPEVVIKRNKEKQSLRSGRKSNSTFIHKTKLNLKQAKNYLKYSIVRKSETLDRMFQRFRSSAKIIPRGAMNCGGQFCHLIDLSALEGDKEVIYFPIYQTLVQKTKLLKSKLDARVVTTLEKGFLSSLLHFFSKLRPLKQKSTINAYSDNIFEAIKTPQKSNSNKLHKFVSPKPQNSHFQKEWDPYANYNEGDSLYQSESALSTSQNNSLIIGSKLPQNSSPKVNLRVKFPYLGQSKEEEGSQKERKKINLPKLRSMVPLNLEVNGAKYPEGEVEISESFRGEQRGEEGGAQLEVFVCLTCFCVYFNIERNYLNK